MGLTRPPNPWCPDERLRADKLRPRAQGGGLGLSHPAVSACVPLATRSPFLHWGPWENDMSPGL